MHNSLTGKDTAEFQTQLQSLRDRFKFRSEKIFDHNLGLSAAFSQWRARSHCRLPHGYALRVELHFVATGGLDECNWVVDFGSLKPFKQILEDTFDHKFLVAFDDPRLPVWQVQHEAGEIDMVVVAATGCEMFAAMIFEAAEQWLIDAGYFPRVNLERVRVSEHGGNAASATPW